MSEKIKSKIRNQIILILVLVPLVLAEGPDGIKKITYKCKIFELHSNTTFFGRIQLEEFDQRTSVRITAYKENKMNSEGFFIHYSIPIKEFEEDLNDKKVKRFQVNATSEWFSRIGTNFRTAYTVSKIVSSSGNKDNNTIASIDILNQSPYSIKNLANRLRIICLYAKGDTSHFVNLAFREFEEMKGWTVGIVLSIILTIFPLILTIYLLVTADTYSGRDKLKGISALTYVGTFIYLFLSLRMLFVLWSVTPYPVMFYWLFLSFNTCILFKYSLDNSNYYDDIKGPIFVIISLLLIPIIILSFFKFSFEIISLLFFYGNLAVFLDLIFIKCLKLRSYKEDYEIGKNIAYSISIQLPFVFVIYYPSNVWFVPTGLTWKQFWIYMGIWLGSYIVFALLNLFGGFCGFLGKCLCCCRTKSKNSYKNPPPPPKEPEPKPKDNTPIGLLEFEIEQSEKKVTLAEKDLQDQIKLLEDQKKKITDIEKNIGDKETEIGKMKSKIKDDVKKLEKMIIEKRKEDEKKRKEKEEEERRKNDEKIKNLKGRYGSGGLNYPEEPDKDKEEVLIKKGMIGEAVPIGDVQGYKLPNLPQVDNINVKRD